jgi:glucose-1-phosphate cytidylyltransferase
MKVVILAGGLGTRLSEETGTRPKPMVEIGGMPILWHIMKTYSHFGFNDFVICLGYKGNIIKEFFANYLYNREDLSFDLKNNKYHILSSNTEPWTVTLVETGINTMTGGRIKKVQKYLEGKSFMLTYGDGVADININELLNFHRKRKKILTVSTIQPSGRFGVIKINEDSTVRSFLEKPKQEDIWINAGYMVCEPEVFDYIDDQDHTIWEQEPMQRIARENKMLAFKHEGFWRPMDMLKDKNDLNTLWNSNKAEWKVWI